MTERRSSVTRWAAASRCNWHTCSRNTATGWFSSAAVDSGATSQRSCGLRAFRALNWCFRCWPNERTLAAGHAVGRALGLIGLRVHTDLGEVLRGHASLADREARAAFLNTLRTIVDFGGQRVDAADRLYLTQAIPFLLVWGERDPIIPVEHALAAHAALPGSRLELFPEAGHFPHLDDPLRFVRVLVDFIDSTDPAQIQPDRWKEVLRSGVEHVDSSP